METPSNILPKFRICLEVPKGVPKAQCNHFWRTHFRKVEKTKGAIKVDQLFC